MLGCLDAWSFRPQRTRTGGVGGVWTMEGQAGHGYSMRVVGDEKRKKKKKKTSRNHPGEADDGATSVMIFWFDQIRLRKRPGTPKLDGADLGGSSERQRQRQRQGPGPPIQTRTGQDTDHGPRHRGVRSYYVCCLDTHSDIMHCTDYELLNGRKHTLGLGTA